MIRWIHGVRGRIAHFARDGCRLLFPPHCACCRADLYDDAGDGLLCGQCLERLAPATWPGCSRCGAKVLDSCLTHDHCPLCKNVSLRFDAVITLGSYHAGLRDIVLRMKRPSHGALSVAMGQLLAQRRQERLQELQADVVIPIPMYWARWLHRGTNNPEVLAGCLFHMASGPAVAMMVDLEDLWSDLAQALGS